MLRIVLSMLVLMLCTFALAESYHVTKDTSPASVSSLAELDSGLTDSPEITVVVTGSDTQLAPLYLLAERVPAQQSHRVELRDYGNTSIRSPPVTL